MQHKRPAGRAIAQNAPMYQDIEIARAFGKWPHEFWDLCDDEQELLRWYMVLKSYKDAYGAMTTEQQARFPRSLDRP